MRIELSRMIRRLGGNFADLCHNDDLELFQDIEWNGIYCREIEGGDV